MTADNPPSSPVPFSSLPRRYGGATAEERQQQRRERLLDSAFEVFGRQGYKETTMRMICAQARMTDRYFYEHFESLDDIFLQVRKRLSVELMERLMQVLARPEPDPVLMIRAALANFFEYVKEDPRRARILLLDAMTFSLTSTAVAQTRLGWYAGMVEQRLKARYPHLPPHLDAKLIASGFLGHVTYLAAVWALQNFDTPIEHLVDHAAFSWQGLHHWLADYDASVPVRSAG
ncbi:MAG: TetR/AcrR family transcriptional regulator [Aquabacterium sp.]